MEGINHGIRSVSVMTKRRLSEEKKAIKDEEAKTQDTQNIKELLKQSRHRKRSAKTREEVTKEEIKSQSKSKITFFIYQVYF